MRSAGTGRSTKASSSSACAPLRPKVDERFSEHRLQVSRDAFRQLSAEQGFAEAKITGRGQKAADLTRVTIFLVGEAEVGQPLRDCNSNLRGAKS